MKYFIIFLHLYQTPQYFNLTFSYKKFLMISPPPFFCTHVTYLVVAARLRLWALAVLRQFSSTPSSRKYKHDPSTIRKLRGIASPAKPGSALPSVERGWVWVFKGGEGKRKRNRRIKQFLGQRGKNKSYVQKRINKIHIVVKM